MGQLVGALAREWVAGRVARGELSATSAPVVHARIARLVRTYGHLRPEQLGRAELQEWQAQIGYQAPATRLNSVSVVRQFCHWLVEEGHIVKDPSGALAKVRRPRGTSRALPSSDVAAVLAAAPDQRWRAVTHLMVGCGLRCCEVANLDLDDWDRDSGTLWVRGKFDNERIVPVPKAVAAALHRYMQVRTWRPGPLIWSGKGSMSERTSAKRISERMGEIMTTAGVHRWPRDRRTAHALRHTCGRDVYRRSKNPVLVKGMLGHLSLATTQIYIGEADLDEMRCAMEGRDYRLAATGTEGPV